MKILLSVSEKEKAKGEESQYVQALRAAGVAPAELEIVSPSTPISPHFHFDGLVLSGGADVDPVLYGENPHVDSLKLDRARDDFELRLLARSLHVHDPVLAICRGLQLLNVHLGGALYQDLKTDGPASTIEHRQPEERDEPTHAVTVTDAASKLAQIYRGRCMVNSFHHQAIKAPAHGVRVTARAEDGLIEAFELPNEPWVVAVQWHPEELWRARDGQHLALFKRFVEQCRQWAARTTG
jgi:putative glutamine amidotransferase